MCHCSAFAGPLRDGPAHRLSPQERVRGAWGPGVPPGLGLPPYPALRGVVCVCGGGGGEVAQQESLARRPFPGGFLAIKSQTPAEVLTPSKYTFPCPPLRPRPQAARLPQRLARAQRLASQWRGSGDPRFQLPPPVHQPASSSALGLRLPNARLRVHTGALAKPGPRQGGCS